jgi:hypothetical protein
VKTLTASVRTVVYSTYSFEVDDDYDPDNGSQILEDHWTEFEGGALIDSEIVHETLEDWEIS